MKIKTIIEMDERDVFNLVKAQYPELTNVNFEDVELVINKEESELVEEVKEAPETLEANEVNEEMNPEHNIYGGIY